MASSETSGASADSSQTTEETPPTEEAPRRRRRHRAETESPQENPQGLMPDEIPPPPASVSPQEAAEADREKDRARETRPVSPLKGRASPLKGRKLGPRKKNDTDGATVIKVSHKPVIYVDEGGNRLPDLGPDFAKPVILFGSRIVEGMGMRPFNEKEVNELSEAWAPIFHKYAGFVLPYAPEIIAVGALVSVMYPRVKELDERKRREKADINRKAAADAEAKRRAAPQSNGAQAPGNPPKPENVPTPPNPPGPALRVIDGGLKS